MVSGRGIRRNSLTISTCLMFWFVVTHIATFDTAPLLMTDKVLSSLGLLGIFREEDPETL